MKDGEPKDGQEQEETGRDHLGRFRPGNSGNPKGRPRQIDFIAAVHKHADAEGVDLGLAAWEVSQALLEKARAGDSQAAKLWLDRCCGIQKQELDLNHTGEINRGPSLPSDADMQDWLDKLQERSRNGAT